MSNASYIRPELLKFAIRMEDRMRANASREHLPHSKLDLLEDLRLCCIKLDAAISLHERGEISDDFLMGEAADVANFAFILFRDSTTEKIK